MKLGSLQTSMFLQATFFTTAGKRSDAFLPLAIICRENARTNQQEDSFWRDFPEKVSLSALYILYLALHLLCPARIMSVDGCDSSLRMWWNNLKLPLSDASLVQRTSFEFSQHDVSCYMQLLFSQTHPQVNIISTHSHDPLHRLQLQRVFVTVQHLLQVIMSEGGKHRKLALTFPVFFFFLSRLITEASKKKCRLVFYAQNWLEAARVTQKLFSLK